MTMALTDEHVELASVLRRALDGLGAHEAARRALEAERDELPPFWQQVGELGWFGLHLPEEHGGSGAGLLEACLVMEAVGELCAPGPFLASVLSSAVVDSVGTDQQRKALLPGLADGSVRAAVGLGGSLQVAPEDDGALSGDGGLTLGGGTADHLLLRLGDDLVAVEGDRTGLDVVAAVSVDPTSRVAAVRCTGVRFERADVLVGGAIAARTIGRVLAAAQAAGGASACQHMATEYAKVREQFGRPIGAFQAVKHMCADMLIDAETATAVAWDAARSEGDLDQARFGAAVAAAVALPAFMRCAETNIQVHGGIGFTWDHDAHLYLRRAAALASMFGACDAAPLDLWRLADAGVTRYTDVPLPEATEDIRKEVRSFVAGLDGAPEERGRQLAAAGLVAPEWPRPWGRSAGPLEQYVIKEETRVLPKPVIDVPWVPMTIGQVGTPEQGERYLPGSLTGQIQWCQLSSEPDAGSDAAAVRSRAERVEGGWLVRGQKVWTSHASTATHGLATVRTNRDVPKHAGLSVMVIDMHAEGVTVRPLREIVGGARPSATDFGDTSFNEVFFDDVFVSHDDVIGPVDDGWRIVRQLLGNERVTIGERRSPVEASSLVELLGRICPDDAGYQREVGGAVAEESAVAALNLRRLVRAIAGEDSGAEANVVKVLNSERIQRIADLGLRVLASRGADESEDFAWLYLRSRFTTIGGGTSQINRNVIAERILGLPRDR